MSEQAERFYSEMYSVQDSRISWGEYIGRLYDTDEIELLTEHEIVRCKDCEYLEKHGSFVMCMLPDGDGGYACWIVEPDGFCAWGERKGE